MREVLSDLYSQVQDCSLELERLDQQDASLAGRRECVEKLLTEVKAEQQAAAAERKNTNDALKDIERQMTATRKSFAKQLKDKVKSYDDAEKELAEFLDKTKNRTDDDEKTE